MSNINGWTRLIKWVAAAAASALVLGACGSIRQAGSPAIESKDSVAVVTMANFTETPAAGSSAAAIAANALRQNGFADVRLAPVDASANAMFDTAQRDIGEKKLAWAREQRVKYVLTGAVEEWRYKVGVDGEPVRGRCAGRREGYRSLRCDRFRYILPGVRAALGGRGTPGLWG